MVCFRTENTWSIATYVKGAKNLISPVQTPDTHNLTRKTNTCTLVYQ